MNTARVMPVFTDPRGGGLSVGPTHPKLTRDFKHKNQGIRKAQNKVIFDFCRFLPSDPPTHPPPRGVGQPLKTGLVATTLRPLRRFAMRMLRDVKSKKDGTILLSLLEPDDHIWFTTLSFFLSEPLARHTAAGSMGRTHLEPASSF